MASKDLNLYESGNGGETAVIDNDLVLTEQLYQLVYICLFGGNVEAVTKGNEIEGQVRNDWWGNSILFKNKPNLQFNSLTEKTLRTTPLNSVGRVVIENAAKEDLKNIQSLGNVTVQVMILGVNTVQINVNIVNTDSKQDKVLRYIWDNLKSELVKDVLI